MNEFLDWGSQLGDPKMFQGLSQPVQIALMLGAVALLPTVLVTMTCFTRVVIVLSFVRQGLATQNVPPNSVLIGLSIFLTLFVMRPVIDDVGTNAVAPFRAGKITGPEAIKAGTAPLKTFMLRQTRKQDIALFLYMAGDKSVQDIRDQAERSVRARLGPDRWAHAYSAGRSASIDALMHELDSAL